MKMNRIAVIVLSFTLVSSSICFAGIENNTIKGSSDNICSKFNATMPSGGVADVTIDDSVVNTVGIKDVESLLKTADLLGKDKIHLVTESRLSDQDIKESAKKALFVKNENGDIYGLEVNEAVCNQVGIDEVLGFADEAGEGTIVRITGCVSVDDSKIDLSSFDRCYKNKRASAETVAAGAVGYTIRNGKASKSGDEHKVGNKVLITSVAKGATKKLTTAVKCSFSTTWSGGYDSSAASGLKLTLTQTSELFFSGIKPAITGKNNCRVFYFQKYAQNYKRTQQKIDAKTNEVIGTKVATIVKPTKIVEGSYDTIA